MGKPLPHVVRGQAPDMLGETEGSLGANLQQRDGEAWSLHDQVFNRGNGPRHQRCVFEDDSQFAAVRKVEKRRFAK